ncbi:hypothetical protein DY000_02063239 [Brassica cretica]|uniref:Uncharacterized protein n=1 Tax=Brassica cretica TaxID=69181 RepID=A0ABQ7B088_BRACR|nr:hypothetical protein DY000_02063239 [Brassica cretica]
MSSMRQLRTKHTALRHRIFRRLQGTTPNFKSKVHVDMSRGTNSFSLDSSGTTCDPVVDILLSVAGRFGYLAKSWKGSNPCRH